jgi:NTP pyrophosphatase (non-canonical NTP hydrolase)
MQSNYLQKMNDKQQEILVITQEECAEVIQEISKCFRFGLDNNHKSGIPHRQVLEQEIGDLLCMIDLCMQHQLITQDGIEKAKSKKVGKLRVFSKIFVDNDDK